MSRSLTLLALLALLVLASYGLPLVARAQQERRFVWDRVDVVVSLREDSSLHVTERDRVRFFGGPFRRGYRDIPLARIERIGQMRVSTVSDGAVRALRYVPPSVFSQAVPNTYTFQKVGPNVHIEWSFPPTTSQARTFQLDFDAYGVLRVYDDAEVPYQQLGWAAVDPELTKEARVNGASLIFILPRAIDPDQVTIDGPGGNEPRVHTTDGRSWIWSARDLGPGESLGAILQFPSLVTASKPSWQDASDRRERMLQRRQALLTPILLGLAVLTAVGGSLAVLAAWWTKGRDPETGPVAEFLPEPPDALPPAIVGALVDEAVDQRDIVATLVDLARRGVLGIDDPGQQGLAPRHSYTLTLLQEAPAVSRFEWTLLETIFGHGLGTYGPVALDKVKPRFNQAGSDLRRILSDELVQRGFFAERPSRTRTLWEAAGAVLLIVAVIGIVVVNKALGEFPVAITLLIVALIVLGSLMRGMARYMPRKTVAGAEAAAKWRAFSRYLEAIDQFEDLGKAQELFDRYLPYAIAFGLETSWVRSFARVETPVPRWYGTGRWGRLLTRGGGSSPGAGSAGRAAGTPSLQTISNQAAASLQGSSNSLFAMFNAAGEAFSGTPPAGAVSVAKSGSGFNGSLGALKLGLIVVKGLSGGGGGGFS